MKISLLLFAFCFFLASCRDDKSDSAGNSPTKPADPQEAQTPQTSPQEEATPKDEMTDEEIKKLARYLFGDAMEKAKMTSARVTSTQLVYGIEAFFEEYYYLPGATKGNAMDAMMKSAEGEDGSPLMAALIGLRVAIDENPKLLSFFSTKQAKDGKDGLVRTENSANLFDPWGNPYHVFLNYDGDNQLKPPTGNEILFDRRVVVWSLGPDGKSGTPETDRDNVYSWYRD